MRHINLYFLLLLFISFTGLSQQKELHVNNKTIDYNICHEIKLVKQIPELSAGFIFDIRDAQIIDDCLGLTIVYGGCNGNLELMTDRLITKQSQLNFKARWIEPSMCKALVLTKVLFDLKPFKEIVKEKTATIKITETNFELFYN